MQGFGATLTAKSTMDFPKSRNSFVPVKTNSGRGGAEGFQRATADFVRFHALWNYAQDQYGSKTNSANREKGQLC